MLNKFSGNLLLVLNSLFMRGVIITPNPPRRKSHQKNEQWPKNIFHQILRYFCPLKAKSYSIEKFKGLFNDEKQQFEIDRTSLTSCLNWRKEPTVTDGRTDGMIEASPLKSSRLTAIIYLKPINLHHTRLSNTNPYLRIIATYICI